MDLEGQPHLDDREVVGAEVKSGEPIWFWRRTVLFVVVGFCMVMLWRMVDVPDTRVNDTIAWGLIMVLAALVLGYQGFATAQDIAAIMATRSGRPYAEPEPIEEDPGPVPGAGQ